MGVGGGNHDVRARNAGAFLHLPACLDDDPLWHRDEVAHDNGGANLPVIEHRGLGLNVVEHAFVAALVIVAGQSDAGRRIDGNGGRAQSKFSAVSADVHQAQPRHHNQSAGQFHKSTLGAS